MKITAEILKKSVACEAAVKFVERNFPNGFDRDHIRADGSMLGWYEWLKCREYDSRGNLTKVTDPDGRVWLYEYDSRGNLTKKTYPDGDIWLYEYDSRGNLTKETYHDGRVWLYEYDYAPDGSLVEMRKDGKRIVWFK